LKIVLAGQRSFGASVLSALIEDGHEISCVFAPLPVDSKRDRLAMAAERMGVTLAHGLSARTMPSGVDLVVAAHSHDFVSERVLLGTRFGGIGYHPSLLPLHRGRDAVRWTIKMGDRVAGGSVYWLSNAVDGGPIAAQDYCFVRPDDDAGELWRRDLMPMGVRLLRHAVSDIANGVVVRVRQDESLATWEPSIGRPPLHRPDLLMLPSPGCDWQVQYVTSRH